MICDIFLAWWTLIFISIMPGSWLPQSPTFLGQMKSALKMCDKYRFGKMPIHDWSGAMNQFAILFENRLLNSSFYNSSFKQNF